jgi:hypothetical protein
MHSGIGLYAIPHQTGVAIAPDTAGRLRGQHRGNQGVRKGSIRQASNLFANFLPVLR